MANIKLLKSAMVGATVRRHGWAGTAEDAEAKALIAAGVAKAHNGPLTDDAAVAKDATADLAAKLDGNVGEVTERLAGLSKAELKKLSKLEAKGAGRVTLIAAIDAAAESAE